ncbi:hypothetical protein FPV67DRAFT_1197781 [Lyophyllum atratum]|nr:hypothetical protein FPV67DRAFT_1197781 [Lyophyllum atratum]
MDTSRANSTASHTIHPCLEIPEIFNLICEAIVQAACATQSPQCSNDSYHAPPVTDATCRRDFASLARTCRALHEPATDYLWSELDTFAPLVKCMPRDLWKEERSTTGPFLVFSRAIVPSDFRRFMEKSRRVKKLFLHEGPMYYVGTQHNITSTPDDIYEALSAATGSFALLPNLTSLALSQPTSPAIYDFLGPSIIDFRLFIHLRGAHVSDLHYSFIASLPRRYPRLRLLSVLDAPTPLISDALCGLPELHMLHIPRLSLEPHAIMHIMHLAHLHSLSFKSSDRITLPGSVPMYPAFPALQELRYESEDPADAIQLLRSASFCPLVNIQITSYGGIRESWHLLFQTFSSHISHLSLTDIHLASDHHDDVLSTSEFIHVADIRPLFVFSNLSKLYLDFFSLYIDDDDLDQLARAFPRMKVLHLISAMTAGDGLVTHSGLAAIARRCPEITRLSIRADLSKRIDDELAAPVVPNSSLAYLYLQYPPSASVHATIAAISELFPRLNEMRHVPGFLTAKYRPLR